MVMWEWALGDVRMDTVCSTIFLTSFVPTTIMGMLCSAKFSGSYSASLREWGGGLK